MGPGFNSGLGHGADFFVLVVKSDFHFFKHFKFVKQLMLFIYIFIYLFIVYLLISLFIIYLLIYLLSYLIS